MGGGAKTIEGLGRGLAPGEADDLSRQRGQDFRLQRAEGQDRFHLGQRRKGNSGRLAMGDPGMDAPSRAPRRDLEVLAAALASRQHKIPAIGIAFLQQIPQGFGTGFRRQLDVEIFSEPDRFWALPVDEAARLAFAAASALVA